MNCNSSLSTRSEPIRLACKMEEPVTDPSLVITTHQTEDATIVPHSPQSSQFTSISLQDPLPTFLPPSQTILSATAIERSTSAQSSRSINSSSTTLNATVYGVALVGFDHAQVLLGPNVEFMFPDSLNQNSELKDGLPFLALPDGAHARDEDYTYFHLHLPNLLSNPSSSLDPSSSTSSSPGKAQEAEELNETVFGISCNRQINSHELLNKGKEVTRSTVQKAIVILASKPIFGPLRDKLGVITRTFFAQRDFEDKQILVDLFQSFQQLSQQGNPSSSSSPTRTTTEGLEDRKGKGKEREKRRSILGEREDSDEENGLYMGTFLRELVHKFRFKTLMLLKLLMLQRRVLFFSTTTPVEQLCTFQYSLVALIPALLTSLQDSASPLLSNRSKNLQKPTSLKTSDKGSLIRYLGLPLEIFGQGSFFQPYLPLQQIDQLQQSKTYLVGTTNSIIQQQRDCNIDVVVNLDTTTLQILNPSLTSLITLTPADRKWMDELVTTVDQSWNAEDPTRPEGMGWIGSEDFLRGKFEEYVCSLLACVKFGDFLEKGQHARPEMLLSAPELESYNPSSFNEGFIKAFKQTRAFEIWDKNTDEVIFDLVEPKHPMEGKTNPFEDVGIRLVSGLHDLHLPENLGPTKEAIQRGFVSGSEGIWGAVKWAREEATKRQKELQVNLAAQQSQREKEGGGGVAREKEGKDQSQPQQKEVGEYLAGGVDVASKGAASVAAGLGGLWGKARNSTLFAPTLPSNSNNPSPNLNRPNLNPSLSPSDLLPQARPPSPTPSTISTTSSNKSSSLVTVQAGLTTPPTGSNSTFSSVAGEKRGLRPLSTAVAASPAQPSTNSSSSSSSSPNTSGASGGFSSFFGGIRRSFIEQPPSTTQSSSSTTTSTSTSNPSLSLPSLSSLGWGSSSSRTRSSSTTPTLSPSLVPTNSNNHRRSSTVPLSSTSDDEEDEEQEEVIVVKDLDGSKGEEEVVVLKIRDLDRERERGEARLKGQEDARRRLEGI
ncbi:hypothetical protein JCM5353_002200 [Sporobolomyces roseus]